MGHKKKNDDFEDLDPILMDRVKILMEHFGEHEEIEESEDEEELDLGASR